MLPLALLIVRGRFGRALRAVRDSEIASTANGVSTAGIKTAAFGISAFFCGVAGALYAIGITYVNPDTFPIELSILLLVGVVIGGAGSTCGHALRRVLRRVHPDQLGPGPARPGLDRVHHIDTHAAGSGLVVYGVVLLAVLYVAPPAWRGSSGACSRAARRSPPGRSRAGRRRAIRRPEPKAVKPSFSFRPQPRIVRP